MTGVVIGSLVADTGRMSDARTYAVTEQPEHGFVSVWPTGGFIYTPDPRARLDAHRSGAVLMDGFRAVVGEVDGTVTELHVHGVPVHPARAAVIATVPVGDRPSVPVLAPDDSRVYVTHVDEPVVTVIDATTYTAMESVVVPARASGVSFSRDGGYVFAALVGGSVAVIDAASLAVVDRLTAPPSDVEPTRDRDPETEATIRGAINLDPSDLVRGIAVNAPGTCAFVANTAYGSVSVVKIAAPSSRA